MPERAGTLLLTAAVLVAGGCASDAPRSAPQQQSEDWRASLNDAAGRRQTKPDRRAQAAPLPPGLELPPLVEAESPCGSRPEAIERFTEAAPAREAGVVEAVHRYVSGRAALVRGQFETAVRELERARELDPASPEVLTALGEARLGSGDRLAALAAFRDSFRAGGRAPGMLLLLGLQAQREGDQAGSAVYLATLLSQPMRDLDPAIEPLANVALGEALLALGHPRAAREALESGLDLPAAWSEWTRFSTEISALYRARPILWRVVGDTSLRLGDFDAAMKAYAQAAEILPAQAWSLSERRVLAAMRSGNPAAAAMIVLDEIGEDPSLLRDRHVRLVRHIAQHRSQEGPLGVVGAGTAARAKLGEGLTATLESRLVRLEASVLADGDAVQLLAQRLRERPLDEPVMSDLAARLPARAGAILRLCGPIAETEPDSATLLARAILERFGAPEAGIRPRDAGERVLLSAWLREAGEVARAVEAAAPLADSAQPSSLETYGLAAAAAADWDGVRRALSLLKGTDASSAYARANLLRALQRADEALAELRTIDVSTMSPERRLLAADIAREAGDAAAVRDLLLPSLDDDPYLEETYTGLIEAFRTMGETENDRRRLLGAKLQTMSPAGKALRLLRARELVMGGQHGHAFAEVMEQARHTPRDPETRDLALEIAARAVEAEPARLEPALAWLASAHHWDPAWSAAAEARLRLAAGQSDEAEKLLHQKMAGDGSRLLARLLEVVLRQSGRHDEADAAALQRLAAEPATFDNVAVHAAILARRKEPEAAVRLLETLPSGSQLSPRQAAVLLSGVGPAADAAVQGGLPQEMRASLKLLEAALAHGSGSADLRLRQLQLGLTLLDVAAAQAGLRGLEEMGLLRDLARAERLEVEGLSDAEVAAALCYEYGVRFGQRERQAEAESMYRLALTHDPRHGWTCNNLGYDLVERGEQIEEAERLLLIAYEELGTEASVIDSLGWLRYRQGALADRADEATGGRMLGAVSLLRRAVETPRGSGNPTLRDHYGDALWRAGRRAEAMEQWREGLRAASALLQSGLAQQAEAAAFVAELTERRQQLQQKMHAVSAGQAPAVAPLFPGVTLEARASTENNPGASRQE